jgi:hypothetical protein
LAPTQTAAGLGAALNSAPAQGEAFEDEASAEIELAPTQTPQAPAPSNLVCRLVPSPSAGEVGAETGGHNTHPKHTSGFRWDVPQGAANGGSAAGPLLPAAAGPPEKKFRKQESAEQKAHRAKLDKARKEAKKSAAAASAGV